MLAGNLLACFDLASRGEPQSELVPGLAPHRCLAVPACADADVACRRGDLRGCTALGYQLAFDERVEQEIGRAAEAFFRACQVDDLDACYRLAQIELAQQDDAAVHRAKDRFAQACRAGHMFACIQARSLGAVGYEVVEQACHEGLALACLWPDEH